MTIQAVLKNVLKILLLTIFLFALFVVVFPLVGVGQDLPEPAENQEQGALLFLTICFVQAAVVSLYILGSRWTGWRLILALFTVMSLGGAVLAQMDSVWFLPEMSRVLIGKLILATAIQSALFASFAVWVLGKARPDPTRPVPVNPVHRSPPAWALSFVLLAVVHMVLYFGCGYYIAWKSTALIEFYGGSDPGSFMLQLLSIARDDPMLFPFQFLRGLLWALIAALLAAGWGRSGRSAAMISAAMFIALFCLLLLIPNPLMPEAVRHAHFLETVVSKGLFGLLSSWFLFSGIKKPAT